MIKTGILYMWQLPQHLLALAIIGIFRAKPVHLANKIVYYQIPINMSFSLGKYIFISQKWYILPDGKHDIMDERFVRLLYHEYGHSKQSLYLGWLYLLVIGIPSMTMNLLSKYRVLNPDKYYERWPESWADSLGHVYRKSKPFGIK